MNIGLIGSSESKTKLKTNFVHSMQIKKITSHYKTGAYVITPKLFT